MSNYVRIVCVTHQEVHPHERGHIVAVGTGASAFRADTSWTVEEVLAAMNSGTTFFTKSESTGKIAFVEPYHCSRCRRTFIRSSPDAVKDNNLDNMRSCAWAA